MTPRGPAAGFSLVELVVVVAVLAVLAVGAGLATGRGAGGTADLTLFERQAAAARARAVLARQPQGLFVTGRGLRRAALTEDGWEAAGAELRWRGGVALRLGTPRRGAGAPHLVFLPDGGGSAFSLSFAGGGGRCEGDGAGAVTCRDG